MRLRCLSQPALLEIVQAALRTLWHTGCHVQLVQARQVLGDSGAGVQGETVRVPENLVWQALGSAPRRVRLADGHGAAIELGGAGRYLSTGSDGQFLLAADGHSSQAGTLEGLVALTRVAEALPAISAVNLQLIPSEMRGNAAQLAAIAAVLANSRKHHLTVPLNHSLARAWVEMAEIAYPGVDLHGTPLLSGVAVTQSPLVLDRDNCLKLLFFAERGLPVLTMPCPMAGASSPFTLAGTLALALAEALLELVLVQCYRPGSPTVLGGAPTIMDMATGTVTYAAPEFSLLCNSLAQLARHLHLPGYVPLAHPDAVSLDEQCAAEKAFSFLNLLAGDAHLFGGAGSLGKTAIVSCEQLVIDNELYLWAQRFRRGIGVSAGTLAEATIAEVGPGGDFLGTENTLHYLHSGEHFQPQVLNRRLAEAGASSLLATAGARVREILQHARPVLPDSTMAELERYAREQAPALDAASD